VEELGSLSEGDHIEATTKMLHHIANVESINVIAKVRVLHFSAREVMGIDQRPAFGEVHDNEVRLVPNANLVLRGDVHVEQNTWRRSQDCGSVGIAVRANSVEPSTKNTRLLTWSKPMHFFPVE